MNNFLKNIADKFFPKKYATGSLDGAQDTRTVIASSIPGAVSSDRPKKKITDLSMFSVFNQGWLGTCVAHAVIFYKMFLDWKETGQIVVYSRRWFYAFVRFFSRMTEAMGQGLFPLDAMKVIINVGTIKDRGDDDNTLAHEDYVDVTFTAQDNGAAQAYRAKGYAMVLSSAEAIMQALFKFDLVLVSMPYSPAEWMGGLLKRIFYWISRHYVVIYGYEELDNGDVKFYFRNSWGMWGFGGNGEFLYSEYGDKMNDMYVLTDLPNDILQRAKNSRYVFLNNLKLGSRGTDVTKLQEYLKILGIFTLDTTGYFGPVTVDCVKQYQRLRGIQETGNFYPITRATMNKDNEADSKPMSKLDLWCEAIQIHEGYYEGSRSYRNNNPGNLKYIGQVGTTGKDSGGFAVFKDYAAGYMALRNMLAHAATGLSKVYRPTMTILEFFQIFAPPFDHNNPNTYADDVAAHIGVSATTPISSLV